MVLSFMLKLQMSNASGDVSLFLGTNWKRCIGLCWRESEWAIGNNAT